MTERTGLRCPRFQTLRQSIEGWLPDHEELPTCVKHHLLIPKLQDMVEWRKVLFQIEDNSNCFLCQPPENTPLHVFTDGSCTVPEHEPLRTASWGFLCANLGELVAAGHLQGPMQTIDRAELMALVSAVRWTQRNDICVWCDSQSTVHAAEFIIEHGYVPASMENYDLWLAFLAALQLRDGLTTLVRWVPSHLQAHQAEDPFEQWLIHWNSVIDAIVTRWNHRRPSFFVELQRRLEEKTHMVARACESDASILLSSS